MRHPSTLIAGTAAAVIACVLTPLGAAHPARSSARPSGFPLVWRASDDTLVGIEQGPTLRRIHGVWDLRSNDGAAKAYLYAAWREALSKQSKPVLCGGLRYAGRDVLETRGRAGEAWFGLAGDTEGTAHLTITRRVAVYRGAPGPPLCVEATGTVDGVSGVLFGFEGTFQLHNDATLVFRSG